VNCDKCNVPAILMKDSTPVYGRDYGPLWICSNFPRCDARCGCHPGTHRPLGSLADRETRNLRKAVHNAFDPLWKRGTIKRSRAYETLAERMQIAVSECHVGMFTAEQCRQALRIITRMCKKSDQLYPSVEVIGRDYVPSTSNECPF